MIHRGQYSVAVLAACLVLGAASVAGEADMMKALMERVNALEQKNAELERRANAEKSAGAAVDEAIKKEEDTAKNVTSSVAITIGGYIDTAFEYNFNQPKNQNTNLHVFDVDSNSYDIHLAELTFDALPKKACEAGFRLDVAWGTDTRVITSTDKYSLQSNRNSQYIDSDFKQAYVEYLFGVGCGCGGGEQKYITCDMGKFVTWAGFETIEGADNFNSSRSFLFGYAIPFTHTGFRATYDVFKSDCNTWTIGAGVYNGWDNTQDQNTGKTLALYSDWKPAKWFEWVGTAIAGQEQAIDNRAVFATATNAFNAGDPTSPGTAGFNQLNAGDTLLGTLDGGRDAQLYTSFNKGTRFLLDTSLIFKPLCDAHRDDLTIAVNDDYGRQTGEPIRGVQPGGPGSPFPGVPGTFGTSGVGSWYGVAGYVKWQFAKKWYVAGRGEYFNDEDGARTGIKQRLTEETITLDYALTDNLHTRLEFRHDGSDKGVFDDGHDKYLGNLNNPFDKKDQNTVLYSWLYKF